jgi:hypothetical protein
MTNDEYRMTIASSDDFADISSFDIRHRTLIVRR